MVRAIDQTSDSAPRTRCRSWISYASAILATGAISLPLLSNTTSAVSPRTTPPIGKQLAELKGSDTVARGRFDKSVAISSTSAVVGASMHAMDYFTVSGRLNAVTAISASNAWAVGCTNCSTSTPMSLIVHWNGTAWKREPGAAGAAGILYGVAATSADNAWAVGSSYSGKALIMHWNGTTWKREPSATGGLSAVAATSADNAWAVGSLILHWNGTTWKRVPSPSVGLSAVAATSAGDAWAAGSTYSTVTGSHSLIARWNGKVWKRVPSASPVSNGVGLSGVAAVSARSAWAVGCSECGLGGFADSLIERWNGASWKQVPSPSGDLFAVAATAARSAWAVGGFYAVIGASQSLRTLALRWNGATWEKVPSPSPGAEAALYGVAATSATNAWAVGAYETVSGSGGSDKTLIFHWTGTAWK